VSADPDQQLTIYRHQIEDQARSLAAQLMEPYEAVEEALWQWVVQSTLVLVHDSQIEILSQGGWNNAIFRAALAAWKQNHPQRYLDLRPEDTLED